MARKKKQDKSPDQRERPKVRRGAITQDVTPKKDKVPGRVANPPSPGPTLLQDQVDDPGVWYTMTQGDIYIESPDSVIHTIDGKPVVAKLDGFILECNGPKKTGGTTRRFYPDHADEDIAERDAAMVSAIRAWMKKYPEQRAQANLIEHTGSEMAPPIPAWNQITADAAVRAIEDYKLNPLMCVTYELRNKRREDVLNAIEAWNIEQEAAKAEQVEADADPQGEVDAVAI